MPPFSSVGDLALGGVDRHREADPDAAVEPEPPVSICELMPITSPASFSSGPPELPGLIGASVCSTLSIVKPFGAVIWRCSAEITPVVSVRSRSNGLPIASTGSPTCDGARVAERQRMQRQPVGRDPQDREIVRGVLADHLRFDRLAFFEAHRDLDRVLDDVIVGQDRAVGVDHDARAGVLALALRLLRPPPNRFNDDSDFCTTVEVTNATPGASRT